MSTQSPPVPPQPTLPPQPVTPENGLGTASLVLGILSLVGAWIPFAGFASYVTSIIGIVTGILGRKRARAGRATNGGAATGGLVTSILGLASVVLATVVYSGLLYAAATTDPSDLPTTAPSAASSHAGKAKAAEAGIGDSVKDGKFTFTVTKVRTGVKEIGNSTIGKKAQGQFVIVSVTVKNHGDEAQTFTSSDQTVFDKAGRKYSATDEAAVYLKDSNAFLNDINPGNAVKGMLVFDMPKKAHASTIELHDSPFSGGVSVSLR